MRASGSRSGFPFTGVSRALVELSGIWHGAVSQEGSRCEHQAELSCRPAFRKHPRFVEEPLGFVDPARYRKVVGERELLGRRRDQRVPFRVRQLDASLQLLFLALAAQRVEGPAEVAQDEPLDVVIGPARLDELRVVREPERREPPVVVVAPVFPWSWLALVRALVVESVPLASYGWTFPTGALPARSRRRRGSSGATAGRAVTAAGSRRDRARRRSPCSRRVPSVDSTRSRQLASASARPPPP